MAAAGGSGGSGTRAFTDPHGVLNLPSTASRDDVKAAFRRLALQVHPDVDPSPQAAARFRDIKRAADVLLKGHQAVGPGPLSAAAAWRESYSQAGAQAAHAAPDWRPRSPRTALWFCAATLVGGFGVLYLALLSHEWLAGYTWLTPSEVDKRRRHPTPQRQKLAQLMMQPRKPPEEQ